MSNYDALVIVSFGGPDQADDVLPFLENVLRGRNVPRERMLDVAEHYYHFGGASPINAENRSLVAGLKRLLEEQGPQIPVYWGNRNWHPFLADTLQQMAQDGVKKALAFVTSSFGSYSGCRQYLEDIAKARTAVGEHAPQIDKLRLFYNHPGFLESMTDRVRVATSLFGPSRIEEIALIFTAHSLPASMAATSPYEKQLAEACRLISADAGFSRWRLSYQSRSGPPTQPWLEPDICDELRRLHAQENVRRVLLAPVGFLCDHMEVIYDLDTEAKNVCDELGIEMVRAKTVGTHPRFIAMIRELILERVSDGSPRLACGSHPAWPDVCPADCCVPPQRPTRSPA